MAKNVRSDRWKHGKTPATCPKCDLPIMPGQWVQVAPGRGRVLAHAYRCPDRRQLLRKYAGGGR